METEGECEAAATGSDGFGASPGIASGPVRVIREPLDLAQVTPGEILVASNIDPGWTSVFPRVAGLVTETGGLLSHGALLAREYGIPAVMSVPGAVERFATGQRIRIDGRAGTVASSNLEDT